MQKPKLGYKFVRSLFEKFEEIPIDWINSTLENEAELSAGGTPSRTESKYWDNGTIPWISSGEVRNNEINESKEKITELGLRESAAKIFLKDTVLIAITGQGLTRGRIAMLSIEAATNQSVIGITCKEDLDSKYLFYALQNQYQRLRGISQGSNQAGLNLEIMKKFRISRPEKMSEQKKIASILMNIDSLIRVQKKIIGANPKNQEIEIGRNLESLKKGLMQKLLTGQIRVKV